MALTVDATIRDVLPTLQNPEEYVRVVLGNMSACKREHGNASVRIGVTGTGQVPYHKVTYTDADGREQLFGAFDGKHRFENVEIGATRWSNSTLSFDDVQQILGNLRSYKRR